MIIVSGTKIFHNCGSVNNILSLLKNDALYISYFIAYCKKKPILLTSLWELKQKKWSQDGKKNRSEEKKALYWSFPFYAFNKSYWINMTCKEGLIQLSHSYEFCVKKSILVIPNTSPVSMEKDKDRPGFSHYLCLGKGLIWSIRRASF